MSDLFHLIFVTFDFSLGESSPADTDPVSFFGQAQLKLSEEETNRWQREAHRCHCTDKVDGFHENLARVVDVLVFDLTEMHPRGSAWAKFLSIIHMSCCELTVGTSNVILI